MTPSPATIPTGRCSALDQIEAPSEATSQVGSTILWFESQKLFKSIRTPTIGITHSRKGAARYRAIDWSGKGLLSRLTSKIGTNAKTGMVHACDPRRPNATLAATIKA